MEVEKTIKTIEVPTYIERVKWVGTTLFIIGAVLVSVSTWFSSNPWTFGTFLIGHTLWTWAGVEEEDKALITLNAGMLFMDVVAIWTRAM